MKTDFLGQELKEGSRVLSYFDCGYGGLRWGTVIGFTPKMVKVLFHKSKKTETRYAEDLVVMTESQQQLLTFKILTQ